MLRALAVAALLVLAGCTGLVPDGETRTESPVTAAPVPGASDSDVPLPTRNGTVDRDRGVVRQRFGPLTDDAIVANGTRYRLVSDDPDEDYRTEPSNGTLPYVPLAGTGRLDQVLAEDGYRRIDTV